jgi:V/A-type H+-transporting ATPase subunit D
MTRKIRLTRPELKKYRDARARYERYLPMLKLKQQQLQMAVQDATARRVNAEQSLETIDATIRRYERVLADRAGVCWDKWATPNQRNESVRNIAGVEVIVLEGVHFPPARYSLFSTPPWVDRMLADLRERAWQQALVDSLQREECLLWESLTRVMQRVNLFEQIMIPQATQAIRVIRIRLGDDMTSAVGRAKIAKSKLAATFADGGR